MRFFFFYVDFVIKYDLLLFESIYLISMCVFDLMIINLLDIFFLCMVLVKKKNIFCILYFY